MKNCQQCHKKIENFEEYYERQDRTGNVLYTICKDCGKKLPLGN